ncbi:NAD(P)-dependent malic enzyme [Leucobacter musarum]|uniref:NAD(P)-dependent malic enzyme n=1 Tax=Leucobacter musarum TaxID=1930747 RepID=UPI0006A7E5FB|nr:NADP-dependent malic enzyme [Leucobacter musarum]
MNHASPASAVTGTPAPQFSEEDIFAGHELGKLTVELTRPIASQRDLSIAYTPGVAQVCRAIASDVTVADTHTWASRLVAVISDGTAVLGLGDIGPKASMPVMEGKSALFKTFGDLNSIPIVLDTTDSDEIVETITRIAPSFGAINLEDIAAPRCFDIERRLIEALDIPVMHDDQHGTAVVVLAALFNAVRLVEKDLAQLRVVVSGAGAAGIAVSEILLAVGISDIIVLDSRGVLSAAPGGANPFKADLAGRTNPRDVTGGLREVLVDADVFIGVSGGTVPEDYLATMASDAIIFALSNPDPEVMPDVAARYATIVATGRSDFPNQINNVLAFPGIFRGALDARARRITLAMKIAAARAIADIVGDDLSVGQIVPSPLDPRVAHAVAAAVIAEATGTVAE